MNKLGWFGVGAEGIHTSLSKENRPESETQSDRSDSTTSSASHSNGSGGGGVGATTTSSRPPPSGVGSPLTRMPSTDALNRSLHNDSGHGNKSTAQMIQDLRTANADLVSKISKMEADFMNQVHEITSQMAERELQYKEEAKNKDQQIQTFQNRAKSVERRIRERDQQMSALKEEKAMQMHQITDLKNQLYQLVSCFPLFSI